jgi:hypothetical protein
VLLASVLVVVVSTVIVGGLSQEFMDCLTLPAAQSRLIEINLLPGMNQEDDTSVNSAAVRPAFLHLDACVRIKCKLLLCWGLASCLNAVIFITVYSSSSSSLSSSFPALWLPVHRLCQGAVSFVPQPSRQWGNRHTYGLLWYSELFFATIPLLCTACGAAGTFQQAA